MYIDDFRISYLEPWKHWEKKEQVIFDPRIGRPGRMRKDWFNKKFLKAKAKFTLLKIYFPERFEDIEEFFD